MNKVKIAIIGAGRQANRAHYPSLAAMEDVEIVGICDLDDERLNSTADQYGIEQRFHDYRTMLAETQPDAVYVIMEVHLLYDIVYHAITNGFHVFIEKPPFLTTFQAESMAELAERHSRLTMVGFERRFAPLLVKTRQLVESRAPILQARAAVFKNHADLESPYHRGTIDFLTTDGIHCVDWLRWACGGEVKHVASKVRKLDKPYANAYTALIEFDNGAVGELSCNWIVGSRQWLFEMHALRSICLCQHDRPGRSSFNFGRGRRRARWAVAQRGRRLAVEHGRGSRQLRTPSLSGLLCGEPLFHRLH